MFQKIRKEITDHPYYIVAIVILVGVLLYTFRSPIKNDSPLAPLKESINIPLTTSLATAPRTSPTDSNVELNQTYTAKVNGQTMSIPIVPSKTPNGTKGIITQEVDMTPIVNKIVKDAVKDSKKNWEVGAGLGVHQGDVYIPLEIQRNYKDDKAIALELHINKELKVTGGELKYKWLF